jgi:hypothetical protein
MVLVTIKEITFSSFFFEDYGLAVSRYDYLKIIRPTAGRISFFF